MASGSTKRIIVVQARLESQRRSGKGLALIGSKTLVSRVLDRTLAIDGVDTFILATTVRDADDALVEEVSKAYGASIVIVRGSSEDVQSRFIQAMEPFGSCLVGRVTADDPFQDPALYTQGFDLLATSGADYVCIGTDPIPLGMDIEVFTSEALVKSRQLYPTQDNLEHVTLEMTRQPEFVREHLFVPDLMGTARLTVDYEEDITFATLVAKKIDELGGAFDHATTLAAVELITHAGSRELT
jgi:spore coat polysaccharide biosynthesis protein SpsF